VCACGTEDRSPWRTGQDHRRTRFGVTATDTADRGARGNAVSAVTVSAATSRGKEQRRGADWRGGAGAEHGRGAERDGAPCGAVRYDKGRTTSHRPPVRQHSERSPPNTADTPSTALSLRTYSLHSPCRPSRQRRCCNDPHRTARAYAHTRRGAGEQPPHRPHPSQRHRSRRAAGEDNTAKQTGRTEREQVSGSCDGGCVTESYRRTSDLSRSALRSARGTCTAADTTQRERHKPKPSGVSTTHSTGHDSTAQHSNRTGQHSDRRARAGGCPNSALR
jgi:hypothetical protein